MNQMIVKQNILKIACYANLNLTDVKILDNVTIITDYSFFSNLLTNLLIPDSVTTIGTGAFAKNNLKNIKLSNSLTKIDDYSFYMNEISSVKIPNSVIYIGEGAFSENKLKKVEISDNVSFIGPKAFDAIDVVYNDVFLSKDIIEKFGTENIIRIYKLVKYISIYKINNMSKGVLESIPLDIESMKEINLNIKKYNDLLNRLKLSDNDSSLFKLCYALGFFKGFITCDEMVKIVNKYSIAIINESWKNVKLTCYKPKYKDVFMKLFDEDNMEYNNKNISGRLYTSFEMISDYTLKRHKEAISKKNTEIKVERDSVKVQELSDLKKNLKNISYEDICYYINHNTFDVRDQNEKLLSVVNELAVHINQDEFDEIQDIYEQSKNVLKNIPSVKDDLKNNITYHWSKSDNPVNIILGYLVDCCAKLGAAGEDIMRQSMINPDIANLIIYDENNQVLGKATAYYNSRKKYILFNNAEVKVTKELKNSKERRREILNALLRAVDDLTKAFKKNNVNINEVRIGMGHNDLALAIKEAKIEIELDDLFDNYHYDGYIGDANGEEGQAILYKDDKLTKENKLL